MVLDVDIFLNFETVDYLFNNYIIENTQQSCLHFLNNQSNLTFLQKHPAKNTKLQIFVDVLVIQKFVDLS